MHRRALIRYFAAIAAFLQFATDGSAQQKPGRNPEPRNGSDIYVIVKAKLYEVDDAFYKKLAKARWLSLADLEELERQFLNPQKGKAPATDSLFPLLEKQRLLQAGKEVNIDPGKEGVLLTAIKQVNYLPNPEQLRQGKKRPQIIATGFTLSAQVHITADRRFVRAKFTEKSVELEGIEKVKVVVDLKKGTEAVAELVFTKEAILSQASYIPDGGSILLPLHHRPRATRNKDRWLVVEITPRIYIEEEERAIRSQTPK